MREALRLGGVRYFYTTKMTWSAITRFPYSSFVWRGADGSEIVAHLCSTNYNGNVEDPFNTCMPPGVGRMAAPRRIVQTAGELFFFHAIQFQRNDFRIVPIGPRATQPDRDGSYMGSPAARWFRYDEAAGEYATFEGQHSLVTLDHEEPEVVDYVAQVMIHRRRHPWLARARTTVEHLANETIAIRAAADDARALLLLNAGDTSFRFPVEVTGLTVAEASDPDARPGDPALVPGHGWIILSS